MADNGAKKVIDFNDYIGGDEALAQAARALRSLSKDVTALSKTLVDDSGRIKAGFDNIKAAFAELEAKRLKLDLISPEDKKLLADYIKQVGDLKAARAEYTAAQNAQKVLQQGLTDSVRGFNSELAKQKQALKDAVAANDLEAQRKAAAAIRQTTQETKDLSAALRGANSVFTAAKGSYDSLVIENAKLTATLRGLQNGLGGTSDEAVRLQLQIDKNNSTLREFDQNLGLGYRNVGRYAESFEGVVKELAKARIAQQDYADGSAKAAAGQLRIAGFQTAAQKAAAQAGLSYEQANAAIEAQVQAITPLTQALNRLQKEQTETAQSAGAESEAYRKIGFQIQQTQQQIDETIATAGKAAGGTNLAGQLGFTKEGLLGAVTQLGVGFAGVQAIIGGITGTVREAFGADSEFQSALSSLSALTGATGEDLQYLSDRAQELGPRVGKSAAEVLKAFELIGSAQPELLKSGAALSAVTEQALLLAAASGDDLPAAAEALTGVMNQFQAPAAEAARYVNALAAGAKEGAATIPQAAASLKYFGVNAASANISVEKSVALIQALAERSIKGEQAGTQLRNILAKLASGAKDTNPEVVGLSTALDNLGKRNLSTAQYVKLFGLENANTAKILVQNRQRVEELTTAVTGTNVANEQAAKQLDNISTASNRFGATLKNLAISALDPFTRGLSSTLNQLSALFAKLSGSTKTIQDTTAATTANGLANAETARSAQALLTRYQELVEKGVKPTKDGKGELNLITLQLRDSLGESAVAIDKETGQLLLNEEATRSLIKQKLLLSNQAVSTLVLQADALKEQIQQQEQANGRIQREITSREQLTGITKQQAAALSNVNDTFEQLPGEGVQKLYQATIRLGDGSIALKKLQADYAATLEALKKFGPEAVKLAQQQAQAAKIAAAPPTAPAENEVILDRAAKAQAERTKQGLQIQLDATQRRIDDLKRLQTEQNKLFEDHQISEAVFRASVATTQDQVTDLEYKATLIRIGIARKERDEKIIAINDEAIKAQKARGITSAEIDDIKSAAAIRVRTARDAFGAAYDKEQAAFQKKLEEKLLEFKVVLPTFNVLPKLNYEQRLTSIQEGETAELTIITNALAQGKISRAAYEKDMLDRRRRTNDAELKLAREFGKDTHALELEQAKISLETAEQLSAARQRIAEKTGNTLITLDGYYTQFRQNALDTQVQNVQAAYDAELVAAGENTALKTQIQKKYDKELKKLAYDKAKADRDQAAFTVAIQTAVAIAKSFAESPATFGLPFAAVALANGLIQEALIFSRPLPAYFKGRKGGPAEFAEVAERGPEIISNPKTGRFEYVAERAIRPLQQGDNVHTASETAALLTVAGLNHQDAQQPGRLAAAFSGVAEGARAAREEAAERGYDRLAENLAANTAALKQIQAPKITVHRGSDATIENARNRINYLSERLKLPR